MSEMRLQLLPPHSGAQVHSLLGKNHRRPGVMKQPLTGKSFYLDLPAGKNLQFLMRAIQELGGVIESFLSKEVSYIITSRREPKAEKSALGHQNFTSLRKRHVEMTSPADPKGNQNFSQKPRDSVPMSRGKELLQKAIKNQGSTSCNPGGSSSLLANARSWGVQILHVDEMLMHVQQLCLGILHLTEQEQEQKKTKKTCTAMESRAPKVARLKVPFLKIEDSSRKFQPFYHQFRCFPDLSFLGPKGTSPFETLRISLHKRKTKDLEGDELSPQSTACTVPRRKKGYCECCQEDYQELHVHLQSDQHRGFATEASNYMAVDQIASQLSNNFAELSTQMLPTWLPDSPAIGPEHDSSRSLQESPPPSHSPDARASSPRTNGAPREDLLSSGALNLLAPTEQTRGGKATGAEDSKRSGHLGEAIWDSPAAPSPAHQPTLACTSSVELVANPLCCDRPAAPPFLSEQDGSLAGHKRKFQSPNCRAEKKLRVPVEAVPCSGISVPGQEQRDAFSPSPYLTTKVDVLLASPVGAAHQAAVPFQCSSPSKSQGEPLCSGLADLEADALTKMPQDMHCFSTPCPDHHSQPRHPACRPAPLPPTARSSEQHVQAASPSLGENAGCPPARPPPERPGSVGGPWRPAPPAAQAPLLPPEASPLPEPCSSESEWDTQLLSKLDRPQAARDRSLDAEGLRRARIMILDSGYESHLYSVLQPKPELDWERKEEQNQGNCRAETEGAPLLAFETCLDSWTN